MMDPNRFERLGLILILSAPSGAGKTTISKSALAVVPDLSLSVSCTTRVPRAGEIANEDYRFVSAEEFERMRAGGDFAEWARVHDYLYGTPIRPLEEAIASGRDMLLDVDVQGARSIKNRYPDAVAVFVLPPSDQELERRLRSRGTDSEDAILRRLDRARTEMSELRHYDYFLVNREVGGSVRRFAAIVEAERSRVARLRPETFSG